MSRDSYSNFHKKQAKDSNEYDMISWESVDPGNRYQSITYTRFLTKLERDGGILLSPVKCLYWNVDTAKKWFIDENKQKDPETNLSVLSPTNFCKRIEQQLQLISFFPEKHIPDMEIIKQLFQKWIKNELICEKEECLLHNFFHIDNTILTDWSKSHGMELRTLAEQMIANAENGSWLIRHSSVEDSDMIKARVITSKSRDGQMNHTIIAIVYGYGYVVPNIQRGQKLPSLGNGEYVKVSRYVAPSFIHLITDLSEMCNFDRSKLII